MRSARDIQRTVLVGGCEIAFWSAGAPTDPTVLLIHGGGAHSGWWDAVVPALARNRHVVTFDLSGHGASGHREDYDADVWAADVEAVLTEVTSEPAALVGHSMGGMVAIAAAARLPTRVDHTVLVDTRLPLRGLSRLPAQLRLYASAEEALSRFRLVPPQTNADPAVLHRLAEANLRQTPGGWRWRFDPNTRRRITNDDLVHDIERSACRVGYVFGAQSELGGSASAAYLSDTLGRPVPVVAIANSYHHVPLDQPNALAATLDDLLDEPARH